jgi:hypothetical protein
MLASFPAWTLNQIALDSGIPIRQNALEHEIRLINEIPGLLNERSHRATGRPREAGRGTPKLSLGFPYIFSVRKLGVFIRPKVDRAS